MSDLMAFLEAEGIPVVKRRAPFLRSEEERLPIGDHGMMSDEDEEEAEARRRRRVIGDEDETTEPHLRADEDETEDEAAEAESEMMELFQAASTALNAVLSALRQQQRQRRATHGSLGLYG